LTLFGIQLKWLPFITTLSVFIPSISSEFIRDDRSQIVDNPQIRSWDYLPRLLSTHLWSQSGTEHSVHFYRPLFSIWMLIVSTTGGSSSLWWHFTSILLHAITTVAVYKVCEKLLQNRVAALSGGLLFALHPAHVDAVSWVSASNEILFTDFALGAILVLLPAGQTVRLSPARLAGSAGLLAAALLTKETAIAAALKCGGQGRS